VIATERLVTDGNACRGSVQPDDVVSDDDKSSDNEDNNDVIDCSDGLPKGSVFIFCLKEKQETRKHDNEILQKLGFSCWMRDNP
jgi:hypothetical protein